LVSEQRRRNCRRAAARLCQAWIAALLLLGCFGIVAAPAAAVDEGPLVVTMSATPAVASVGQTVVYTTQVSGVPEGKQVLYTWAFEGGTGVGPVITRSYPEPGDYPVAVTVTVSSVAGLSGAADALTVVSAPSSSQAPANGGSAAAGAGGASGKGAPGGGSGLGKPAHAAKRKAKATTTQGVGDPLPVEAPSAQGGAQVEGFLLTDSGAPFALPASTTPASASAGGGDGSGGVPAPVDAAGISGGVGLTIAIVVLGALDERRRISLRDA
jgi:hypothetical protein